MGDLITFYSEKGSHEGLLFYAKRLIRRLDWLSPISTLTSKGDREFDRNIGALLQVQNYVMPVDGFSLDKSGTKYF